MKWEFYNKEKFKCPECGEYRFVRMINENGKFYPENIGRCDRENSCGYMYHASQWLKENPNAQQVFDSGKVEQPKKQIINGYYSFSEELYKAVKADRQRSCEKVKKDFKYTSEFKDYLINNLKFNSEFIQQKMDDYKMVEFTSMNWVEVGTVNEVLKGYTKVIYFYCASKGDIRAVEQIYYNGFKRNKCIPNDILNKEFKNWGNYNTETTEINWCLFGEHLIKEYPDKPIIVTEGVKTAFGMALFFPEYTWLATGSSNRLIHLNFDTKYKVHFLPDAGFVKDKSYEKIWHDKIKKMYGVRFPYSIYDFNYDCSTDEIKEGFDILDLQIIDPQRAKDTISNLFKC
jgi:hypothetical protein